MGFRVDPDGLDEASRALGMGRGLTSDATKAGEYHGMWCQVPVHGGWFGAGHAGIFATFAGAANEAYGSVAAALAKLTAVLDASAEELHAASDSYRMTDADEAAALDATYDAHYGSR